ncbi:MAG: aminodeoxychorismate/anthranilate synthase component I, partial [Planctomycetales bacterium]|nr:aminodeoxychorismate/anthranilate synthase component I [Planctomycetales bacterium]
MTPAPIPPPATAHLCQPLELRLPLPAYLDLFRQGDYAFFLDSALDSHPAGSHSFLGG